MHSQTNQQVHIPPINEKAKWNGQIHSQSQINEFTYSLEMRKRMEWSDALSESNQQVHIHSINEKANGMIRCTESNQQVDILSRNEKARRNGQMHRVKSICSHTSWK